MIEALFVEAPVLPKINMVDLMALGEQEKAELKTALEKSHGTTQLWIHTHFDFEAHNTGPYIEEMDSLIERSSENMPIIALIGAPSSSLTDIKRMKAYTRHYAQTKSGTVYYVRTYPLDPTPYMDPIINRRTEESLTIEKREDNWNQFTELLKELGVNKVIISGKFLWNGKDVYDRGCVGFTVHQLKERGITPFVSKVTSA